MRFPILSTGIRYDYAFQVRVFLVLCVIHNFIRLRGGGGDRFEQHANEQTAEERSSSTNTDNINCAEEPDNEEAKAWRNSIALSMWNQYRAVCERRRQRTIIMRQ